MRNVILVSILTVVLAVGAASVFAGPPVNGTYKSSDGDFNEGREASSWPGANVFLSIGNVLHAEAYPKLGDDWKILCPVVVDVLLLFDTVSGGTGQQGWLLTYSGGIIELGGGGPWAGGDLVYTGIIDTYYETRSMQFVDGEMVGSVSDHSVDAHIVGYPANCVAFGIGNGVWLGSGANPGGAWPDYRDASCVAGPTNGHWGDIRDLTITVQGCEVSTQPVSWGAVKALYQN